MFAQIRAMTVPMSRNAEKRCRIVNPFLNAFMKDP